MRPLQAVGLALFFLLPGVVRAHDVAPTAVIAAVGDVMLGGGVADIVAQSGPNAPFASMMPMLRSVDAVVGNLECTLSSRGASTPAKSAEAVKAHREWLLRGPPEAAAGLASAGFAAMSVANNHTMDYGPIALRDTIAALGDQGIGATGAGSNLVEAWQPAFFVRNGVRFALLGFSTILPRGFAATVRDPGVAAGRNLSTGEIDDRAIKDMAAAIRAARRKADVAIVYYHWGTEGVAAPTAEQVRATHAAIDAGAHLVVGAHPHVVGPIETYRGGLIAYSLGNFVSDTYPGPGARSVLLQVWFRGDQITKWRALPVEIVAGIPRPAKTMSDGRALAPVQREPANR